MPLRNPSDKPAPKADDTYAGLPYENFTNDYTYNPNWRDSYSPEMLKKLDDIIAKNKPKKPAA